MIKIIEITALAHLENQKGKFLYRKKKEEVMEGNYMKRVAKITMSILIVLVVVQADDDPLVQVQLSPDEHYKYCRGKALTKCKKLPWFQRITCDDAETRSCIKAFKGERMFSKLFDETVDCKIEARTKCEKLSQPLRLAFTIKKAEICFFKAIFKWMCGVSALVFNKGFFLANVIEKGKP